jgi:hypothetical protein
LLESSRMAIEGEAGRRNEKLEQRRKKSNPVVRRRIGPLAARATLQFCIVLSRRNIPI